MHGADCAGLDPLGIPLALCSMAPGVAMQRSTGEGKTSVQDLPLQTGKSHNKENVGHKKWKRFILKVWEFCHTDNDLPQRNFFFKNILFCFFLKYTGSRKYDSTKKLNNIPG